MIMLVAHVSAQEEEQDTGDHGGQAEHPYDPWIDLLELSQDP
jgi:hypothetical protein